MATITIQRGHCFRKSGATGTHREQEFANAIGQKLAERLRHHGHLVHLIGADDSVPRADAFIALHCDGSSNRARRGASVGYPDAKGRLLAHAWKEEHTAAGYKGGWLADNYTAALAGYYGYRKAAGTPYRFLAEHATTTNSADEEWLAENIDNAAEAHVRALGRVLGHPNEGGVRILGHGDRGGDVRELQRDLNERGYGLTEDGIFGDDTDAAVRDFQAKHALVVDGLVGRQTRETLAQPLNREDWVIGEIRKRWLPEREKFGLPTAREQRVADGRGRFSVFDHGAIYWTPEHGAHEIYGEIGLSWHRVFDEVGYPTTDEYAITDHPDGWEIRQDFERGIIFWKPGVTWLYREIWRA